MSRLIEETKEIILQATEANLALLDQLKIVDPNSPTIIHLQTIIIQLAIDILEVDTFGGAA